MAGAEGGKASLRPFMCVGIAYFIIAVLYPVFILQTKGESGNWGVRGFIWSFAAGIITAIGALGIVLAFKFQGKPVYVMPLVFGLAPIVNTLVTMIMAGTFKQASAKFYAGIIIVALGAAGVLSFQPKNVKKVDTAELSSIVDSKMTLVSFKQETDTEPKTKSETQSAENPDDAKPADETPADKTDPDDDSVSAAPPKTKKPFNPFAVAICVGVTVICWGSYGPLLHRGQVYMNNSRLRPLLCVGLAYFLVAVLAPWFLLGSFEEPGGWSNTGGVIWSLVAGAAGALGSLGIIYAFNFGGKPIFVMPLIFGFAPVINTLTETVSNNLYSQITPYFLISLAMVIIGAAMVLVFAPRGKKKPAPSEPAIT